MITQKEYELLKHYRATGYGWIARDRDYDLYAFKSMPRKSISFWIEESGFSLPHLVGECDDNIFTCVKWEDEEPTRIDDLIRDYEAHKVIIGDNNVNKAELMKEIEDILDNSGVRDYQQGECNEHGRWSIPSSIIRKIFSAIEKHSPVSVDETVKVTVPQYVADWIQEVKALERSFKLELLFDTTEMPDDVFNWLDERYGDTDILAKAWLDGFEVEKEQLYTVRLANGSCLYKFEISGINWTQEYSNYEKDIHCQLTQSEIESVDPILMQIAKVVE